MSINPDGPPRSESERRAPRPSRLYHEVEASEEPEADSARSGPPFRVARTLRRWNFPPERI